MRYRAWTLIAVASLCTSCSGSARLVPEIVMPAGASITARTAKGHITIRAGDRYSRAYLWGNCKGSVTMWPRTERWYGSLGLYYPGPARHWRECEGVARAVVEEGQQHFETADAAVAWIKARQWMPYAYTNDGLVVGWTTVPARYQLNVEVWQLLIAGSRPSRLSGADDAAITVTNLR
jgi:hypothetical protein